MSDHSNPQRAGGRQPDPSISVVVAVYNRADALRQLLGALARQNFPIDQFEVLVCDDGSDEDLVKVVSDAARATGLHVVHLRQNHLGPGRARNLGIAHARGEVVAFTDSDCLPDTRWLATIDHAFREQGAFVVGVL